MRRIIDAVNTLRIGWVTVSLANDVIATPALDAADVGCRYGILSACVIIAADVGNTYVNFGQPEGG